MPSDPRLTQFQTAADKVVQHLQFEFSKLQTGRASPALVEHITVEAYGQKQGLKTLAGVSIQDPKTILVQPWDRSILQNVEKALQMADTGASIQNDGSHIRVILPAMTQERREQLTKVVARLAEDARVSLRQQRQGTHDTIKAQEKDEDQKFTLLDQMEKTVKTTNEKIDTMKKQKEEELMKV